MEPDHLKSTPPDDAQLDTWLRANTTLPALPDDGFSQRVLTALPAPQRPTGVSPRMLIIGMGAVAGVGFVAFKLLTAAPVEFILPAPDPETAAVLSQLTDPKLHTVLGVTVITLAFVFWRDLRRLVRL